jgi:polar amino acid transport system substrate-binding protein
MLSALLGFACLFSASAQTLEIYTESQVPWQRSGSDGEAVGPSVELVKEIQKRVGNSDPIRMIPWARGYATALGQPNVVLFLMTRTAERNPLFHWVGPVSEGVYGLYLRSNSPIVLNNLQDAKKLTRIGVYRGDVRDQILTNEGFTNLERVTDNTMNMKKLMAGRIEAFASSDATVASTAVEAGFLPSDVRLGVPFFRFQTWIAFSRQTSPDIVKAWAEAFDAMRKDRTVERIIRREIPTWTPPGTPITTF